MLISGLPPGVQEQLIMQQGLRKSLIGAASAGVAIAFFSLVSWALPGGAHTGEGGAYRNAIADRQHEAGAMCSPCATSRAQGLSRESQGEQRLSGQVAEP